MDPEACLLAARQAQQNGEYLQVVEHLFDLL